MATIDEISEMFHTESEKLENMINTVTTKSELSIHEIIEIYYLIINVSSMSIMLKQQLQADEHKILLDKIADIERVIYDKFNSNIHPQIIEKLGKSIQNITKNLQSDNGEKSKEEIENEAKQYEELRQTMSTKEFVEQYGKGLSND